MRDMIILGARQIRPIHICMTKPAFAVLSTGSFLCSADTQQNVHFYWFLGVQACKKQIHCRWKEKA